MGKTKLGRKWAFYANINDKLLLLNKEGAWNDVYPLAVITNRVPGRTFAVYAEGMFTYRSGDVSLMAVIDNGVMQDLSFDEREQLNKPLKNKVEELKGQIRQ